MGMNTRTPAFGLAAVLLLAAPAPIPVAAQLALSGWQGAGPYPLEGVSRGAYPNFYAIFQAEWKEVHADASGAVELGRDFLREWPGGDLALLRRVFRSDAHGTVELELEHSGEVDLFFDRRPLYSGRPGACEPAGATSTAGGCVARLRLPARKGLNEILLMVGSRGDAWSFRATVDRALAPTLADHGALEEVWATPDTFLTPESVLEDPLRPLLYVTSFDNQYGTRTEPSGYISTLSRDGRILEHRWLDGLNAPTGMDIWRDTLYVCERAHLLAVELASRRIVGRWPIPDVTFPNDLVVDEEGAVYISDTRTGNWPDSRIYRFKHGAFEVWVSEGIDGANGLWIQEGSLIVGNSGDGTLKRVDLETRRVEEIVSLGSGILDGIRVDQEGHLLVSFWEGQLFRISPQGEVLELLDAMPGRWNTADFEYLPGEDLLLIPTFTENRVRAFRIRR